MLDERLICFDLEAEDSDEVIKILCGLLEQEGYVDSEYADEVISREKEYPTGLPTEVIKVAIPHADAEHIMKSAFAVAKLKKPVDFYCMDRCGDILPVSLVILLATADPEEQIPALQKIIHVVSSEEILIKVKDTANKTELFDILNEALK